MNRDLSTLRRMFPPSIAIAFGLLLLLVIGISVLSYTTSRNFVEGNRLIVHTYEVLEKIEAFLESTRGAEAAQRGFLIAQEPAFLDSYRTRISDARQDLSELRKLISDNPEQIERADRLRSLLDERLALLEERLKLGTDTTPEAQGLVQRGSAVMEQIQDLAGEMQSAEQDLAIARSLAVERFSSRLRRLNIAVVLAQLLVVLGTFWLVFRHAREQKALQQRLTHLATHDPLTGLGNRTQMDIRIRDVVERARQGGRGALLYTDLDNFKVVNDTLGHEAGDRLLLQIAAALKRSTRSTDDIFRFGGDEFVLMLAESDRANALVTAERIRSEMEELVFSEDERSFRVGASVGVALVDGTMNSEALLAAGDAACYAAKAAGRNRVMEYRRDLEEIAQLVADTDWVTRIRQAIATETLPLWFQPVVELATKEVAFHEVLVRFVDTGKNLTVSPAAFLPALERSGEIAMLDEYVLRQALKIMAQNPDVRLSVNLSGATIGNPAVIDKITSHIGRQDFAAGALTLEITESSVIERLDRAREWMTRARELGARFALDDFGAGFSSLRYLKDLPVEILKIDGSFVRGLDEPFNQVLLRAIRELATTLQIELVAESVETTEIAAAVQQLGIEYGQGYGLGRPSTELVRTVA